MDRADLIERWSTLTRRVLPGMAADQGWPIRRDHCFMRVCLDVAVEGPWPLTLARPAIRNVSDHQLARAVAVAQSVVARPDVLPVLNARSLAWRRAWRSGSA